MSSQRRYTVVPYYSQHDRERCSLCPEVAGWDVWDETCCVATFGTRAEALAECDRLNALPQAEGGQP